jgi:hypothetical protein
MNRKIHLILLLGCVIIAVLDAPRASRLFSEGLAGPYEESARLRSTPVETTTRTGVVRPAAVEGELAVDPATRSPGSNGALLNSSLRFDDGGEPAD